MKILSARIIKRLTETGLSKEMLAKVIDCIEGTPTKEEVKARRLAYNEEQRLRRAEIRARRPER